MKPIVLAMSTLFSGYSLAGKIEGSGNLLTRDLALNGFNKIEISGNFKVNIAKDMVTKIEITGDDNLLPYIKAEVHENLLKVYANIDYVNKEPFLLNIKIPILEKYAGNGKVDANIRGIEEKKVKIKLNGNSSINCMETSISSVELEMLGKGSAKFGNVKSVIGDISNGLNSITVPKKADLSGLKKNIPSSVSYY